jgi:hypothetical protein
MQTTAIVGAGFEADLGLARKHLAGQTSWTSVAVGAEVGHHDQAEVPVVGVANGR